MGGVVAALSLAFIVRYVSRRRARQAVLDFSNQGYANNNLGIQPTNAMRTSDSAYSNHTAATNPTFVSSPSAYSQQVPAGSVPYVQPVFVHGLGMLQPMPQFPPRQQEASYRRPQSSVVLDRVRYSTLSVVPAVQSGMAVVSVVHQFDAENEDELTCLPGEQLQIVHIVDGNEWAVCRRTTNGEIGLVPVAFLGSFAPNGMATQF